ncbi:MULTISPECIES: response regulator [Halorussus]|uniref:Response regulator n=1 Tax=Halorussus aquaticus TaxID=2953748 RepID=A0ABD5PZV8_9EURY|nr:MULTISPECIES: response regulator [Halorussus]NEU57359.1 response regulator [Halorussus sp. MSC15.2]
MKTGILIVDDSEFMRQRVKSALADDEYRIVAEAPNGAWAIQKYKENAEDIDLILMDIVMRKANGLKATAAIKKLDDDVRVVMCTSVGQRQKIQLAARAGADAYITKPFEDEELTDAIDGVVV